MLGSRSLQLQSRISLSPLPLLFIYLLLTFTCIPPFFISSLYSYPSVITSVCFFSQSPFRYYTFCNAESILSSAKYLFRIDAHSVAKNVALSLSLLVISFLLQDDIRREAQTMSLIDHPNVITAYCSFVVERSLWVVMPFMAEGSCLHLMKSAYPDGFEESAIGCFLKETLKALVYLHQHGHIHRDVKVSQL